MLSLVNKDWYDLFREFFLDTYNKLVIYRQENILKYNLRFKMLELVKQFDLTYNKITVRIIY